jgi:class 3 adenylate cyclase/ubiquinone/menaquinone biosynthesis C-methylase UbiE
VTQLLPEGPTVAAVLFTDVVGSTARDRRLGPERADALRRSHFEGASEVVAAHHGRVVKSLGDGLLTVFASPSTAVDAAVELQQLSVRLGQGVRDPIQLRVGVSVGEIRVEPDGDCFGLAVVEAARLCAMAQPGEILVSELTRRLGVAASHPFRTLGPHTLKGIDGPVDVSAVEWRPAITGVTLDMAAIDADPELRRRAPGMLDLIGGDPHVQRVRGRLLELLALRPGESVLDVGSGTGDDVFALREVVGPSGRAVGVDRSETMVAEARRRAADAGIGGVEFVHGDATALDLPDATFDAARSDRVFQYLLEPQLAMNELRRVTRPGGRIAVADTDWETAVFDVGDDGVTARINAAWTASRPNGRAGQQLYRLCKAAGLVDVWVEGIVQVKTELDALYRDGVLPALARAAVDAGAVSAAEASRWIASLELAGSEDRFLRAFSTFVVSARVP